MREEARAKARLAILTLSERRTFDICCLWLDFYGVPPTFVQIAAELVTTPVRAKYLVRELVDKGWMIRLPGGGALPDRFMPARHAQLWSMLPDVEKLVDWCAKGEAEAARVLASDLQARMDRYRDLR